MDAETLKKQECETLLNKVYEEIQTCIEEIDGVKKRLLSERITIPESDYNILYALETHYNGKVQHFLLYINESIENISMKKNQLIKEFDLTGEEEDLLGVEIDNLKDRLKAFENFAKSLHNIKYVTYVTQSEEKVQLIHDLKSFENFRYYEISYCGGPYIDTPCYSIYYGLISKVEDEDKRNALFDSLERITKFLLKTNLYTPKKLDKYMAKEFKKVFEEE